MILKWNWDGGFSFKLVTCTLSSPGLMSPRFSLFLLITANCFLGLFASAAACGSSEHNCCSKEQQRLSNGGADFTESVSQVKEKQGEILHLEREDQRKSRKMKMFENTTRLLTRNVRNAMAWMSGADSNIGLVENLKSNYRVILSAQKCHLHHSITLQPD